MNGKISVSMNEARKLVVNRGFTGAQAARKMGLSANGVYKSKWYKEFKRAKLAAKEQ